MSPAEASDKGVYYLFPIFSRRVFFLSFQPENHSNLSLLKSRVKRYPLRYITISLNNPAPHDSWELYE